MMYIISIGIETVNNKKRSLKMQARVNAMKQKAAIKILDGDFSESGAFLKIEEVENGKVLVSEDVIIERAKAFLNK